MTAAVLSLALKHFHDEKYKVWEALYQLTLHLHCLHLQASVTLRPV